MYIKRSVWERKDDFLNVNRFRFLLSMAHSIVVCHYTLNVAASSHGKLHKNLKLIENNNGMHHIHFVKCKCMNVPIIDLSGIVTCYLKLEMFSK